MLNEADKTTDPSAIPKSITRTRTNALLEIKRSYYPYLYILNEYYQRLKQFSSQGFLMLQGVWLEILEQKPTKREELQKLPSLKKTPI